jgi:His-Xaa-Ser system radical SAM maturase HxsB
MMNLEVATKVIDFMFTSRNPLVRLEFQGGEPLLNWDTLRFIVEHSRKQNKIEKKNLMISLVTNMSLLDKKKTDFLIRYDVEVCTSLDGPEELHNQNRIFKDGGCTYDVVVKGIKLLREEYKKRGIKRKIGALPTITRQSFSYLKEIIDEYVKLEFDCIHLRPTNRLGQAGKNWDKIGYLPEEFNDFWQTSLDYIIDLNKKGIPLKETMTVNMLKKILKKQDPFYVDLESPCGAGRSQLAYAPNGDVYTCDEARMIGNDMFKLGNVLKDKYQDVMKSQNLFYTLQASLLNLWDYNSAFCIWSGTCPVMNLNEQNNPVVKITQTPKYKIHNFQFNYIFEKIIYDKEAYNIFNEWVKE